MTQFLAPRYLPLVLTSLLIACAIGNEAGGGPGSPDRSEGGAASITKNPDGPGSSGGEDGSRLPAFSEEAMSADIGYLADDARQGRFPGTQGDEETLAY